MEDPPRTLPLQHQVVALPDSELPPPVVTYHVALGAWSLESDYLYRRDGHLLLVPAGFTFDLASIPRLVWVVIAPFELSIAAPLLHDFLYRHRGVPAVDHSARTYTRAEADRLFLEVMTREGVRRWRMLAAFGAVRLFGWLAWNGHQEGLAWR